ncbi:DHA2 family multidrug resistance protein [Inquilinus ginsengisoli]|uniref:DHA2 family multidrug resistance protein n=1 Tax=Inquilinus ginsengisoli TaxID=363840 RepID=A0ABU1JMJ1_9PROT|nr:MDR family MFS transporter [Inquilinus ginsengisoli]MDR6289831.1 DHA2 family multidrug resistance protein [Inquilinus ginsengisoli]
MSSITSVTAAPPATPAAGASLTTWISVFSGLLGAFMAVLNIQITNASLPQIEGGIGTGVDNGAWISTSYLIGEIIVIPLTAYLSQVFGFRRFLLVNTALFLTFSVACAFAANLGQMIMLRGIQGFTGGVLIPMAFTLVMTRLPMHQRPMGMALFAITATFAPAIGPTIGGWLTDNYGWEYIFYINLVPGAAMLAGLALTLEREPMRLGLLKEGDWFGIGAMAIGLAALQTVLEEGNKDDWFGSPFIVRLTAIAVVALSLFLWIELKVAKPAVDLRLLLRRNFGFGTLANVFLGFALYGSAYLLPQYLAQVQGYDSEQIGGVMAWTGLPQLLIIPMVPMLMGRLDGRWLVAGGLMVFAASCFMNTHMSLVYGGDQLFMPNIVRAIGQAVVMAPLSAIAMAGIARQESAAASGLFNMLRNLGGAFGTALLGTIVTKREQYHSNIIGQSVTLLRDEVRTRIDQMTSYFMAHGVSDPATAKHQAIVAIGRSVKAQSLVMGFSDTFAVLGVILVASAACVFVMRKGAASGGGGH